MTYSPKVKTLFASTRQRLDRFVSEKCLLSRSFVQRLIREGNITVNGERVKPGFLLRSGDEIKVIIPPAPPQDIVPQPMPLNIVYEDQDLLIVDKPAGLTVHPAPGHPQDTLVNALLARYPSLPGDRPRLGVVHRLDKDTSGLLIVAKSQQAYHFLSQKFKERGVAKRYLALVKGKPLSPEGEIAAPIARHPKKRKEMTIVWGGREAETNYKVIKYFKDCSLLEVTPQTGRTHQIRVHLAFIGHPVVGDKVYGVKSPHVKRQFLHAHYLKFPLPQGGEIELTSPLPPDLEEALKLLS